MTRPGHRSWAGEGSPTRSVVLLLLALTGAWLFHAGSTPGSSSHATFFGGRTTPTPRAASSTLPLGVVSRTALSDGPHRFIATQPSAGPDGTPAPVAYDPCRPVRYVVNSRTAPAGADALLARAIDEIAAATGLQFVFEGTTTEPAVEQRTAYQPERYGDRWVPVLVSWSDPAEHPALGGAVLGRAGSVAVESRDGPLVYVTGTVTLDGPELTSLRAHRGDRQVTATIMHELGHLLGLDHVDDTSQLMAAQFSRVSELQQGDLTGLNRLGTGPCVSAL